MCFKGKRKFVTGYYQFIDIKKNVIGSLLRLYKES